MVSGPSGAGKSTVVAGLAELAPFHFAVSMTTRPRRPGEVEGADYRFVDRQRFEQAITGGELLEWAEYGGNLYGTPRREVEGARAAGRDVLLDIEMVGARTIKRIHPEAIMIFIAPPTLDELARRLRHRGDTAEADIAHRLGVARGQITEAATLFDHHVVNDDVDTAIRRVAGILDWLPTPGEPS